MSKLVEVRNKLDEKRKALHAAFEAAGEDLDFTNATALELLGAKDSVEAVEKIRAANSEIDALYDEAKGLSELSGIRDGLDKVHADLARPASPRHADPLNMGPAGIGDMIVGSDAFASYQKERSPVSGEVAGWGIPELRATLMESTTGFAPENVRSGRLVEGVTRPIQVLDIIPSGTTGGNAYVYMEETLRTHSAAEMREGGTYAEDAYKWTERTEPVRKIGTSIPVTDEQFEDVPGLQSYLNTRLAFGLRQRFDAQVLTGNGTPPNVQGITDRSGIQTQAKGSDPTPDAIYKAMTKIRVTGRSNPNYVVLHPNDWQEIRLLRTADGIYIWGSPSDAGVARTWGLPVVQADSLSEGTGLVGDFMFCQALERRGVDVQVGYTGSQFVEGKKTIRADLRVAFAVYRAPAFCTVTGI